MIRNIMHDPMFLSRRSQDATEADRQVAQDMLDTIQANKEDCVGLAANMIGVLKRIIVIDNGGFYITMYNPEIVGRTGPYEAEEGCLCHEGERKTKRYQNIRVRYQDSEFKTRTENYEGWPAEIIQHEIDHCNGVLI